MSDALGMESLVGIDFLVGGRDRSGMDCYGLVLAGCQRLGFVFPDLWVEIREAWDRGERPIAKCLPLEWREIPVDSPLQRGDIVVSGVGSQHIALALGDGRLLHTTRATKSHIARERSFRGRIKMLFRREAAA